MPEYLLGVDIGGSSCKAALYSTDGRIVGYGYSGYTMVSAQPGQAEQDAETWWSASVAAVRAALRGVDPASIRSVGVSCTNGLVAVDSEGRPLRPAIMLWDQRATAEVAHLRERLGASEIERVTGNPAAPGAYALSTMAWLKNHEPGNFRSAHKFLVPGGFLVARLTDEYTIDVSRACATQLLDIRKRQWHQPFLDGLAIPTEKLPRLLRSQDIAGYVTSSAAAKTGLQPGTPVTAGITDTIAAAIGAGCMSPGCTLIIMGTATRVTMMMNEPEFDLRFMNFPALDSGSWMGLGAINGTGSVLRWAKDVLGSEEVAAARAAGADAYDYLIQRASASPPGAKGLLLLPYLAGERTPIWDARARGVFFGLTLSHTRSDMFRACLEGAGYAIRQAVTIIDERSSPGIERLIIAGTAAQSTVWNQIISNVLNRPIDVLNSTHAEVLGAAILGGLASGVFSDIRAGMLQMAQPTSSVTPEQGSAAIYDSLYEIYASLYPALSSQFATLSRLDLPLVSPR